MKELSAHYNRLRDLPESIVNLEQLTKLVLDGNHFGYNKNADIPEHIGKITSLLHLSVKHNGLKKLPEVGFCLRYERE